MAPPRTIDLPIDLGFVIPRLAAGIVVGASHWDWTGSKSKDGYGHMLVPDGKGGQRRERVHRLVWRIFVGPIGPFPLHHDVDLCHLRSCCNPAHLEPLTDEEHGLAHRSGKCAKGHDLIGHNLMVKPDGRPRCRRCTNDRERERRRARSTFHRGEHKTRCKYGHPWIPENIYVKPKTGHKECLLCIRDRTARLSAVR